MSRKAIALMSPRRIFRDEILDDFWGNTLGTLGMGNYSMNMFEDDDSVVVEIEAPGFNPEDVDISVEDQTLTVSGRVEKKEEEAPSKKYYYQEISQQAFSRSVQLPVRVKAEQAEATFINGIVKIALPKAEEVKPKKISIKAA